MLTAGDGDSVSGGAGNDTLNVETASSLTDKFTTADVEVINVTGLGALSVDAKNLAGATNINTVNSTGVLTINNVASTAVEFGLSGSATNSIDVNYTTGTLNGTADTFKASMNGSSGSAISVDAGFEAVEVKTTAKSDLATLTASGATALTLSGNAELTVADSTIDSFSNYTVSNTGKTKVGNIASVKTFDGATNTGGIIMATNATTTLNNGTASKVITLATSGSLVQTGSGNDIIGVNSSALLSTGSAVIKLGAGDDNLNLSAVGATGEFVYGEAGDDTIYVGGLLAGSDLIDGGTGTDTLNFVTGTHTLIAKGIEKVGVEAANTINFVTIDSAIEIADSTAAAVTFTNLKNGTSYTSTVAKTGDLAVGFAAAQDATVNVNLTKGSAGALTMTNAKDVTVTLGAASAFDGVALDAKGTSLTINATGALTAGAGLGHITASGTEALSTVSVVGSAAVALGNVTNDAKLTSFKMSSAGGAVTVGTLGDLNYVTADQNVTLIEAASTKGAATIGAIDFTGSAATAGGSIATIIASGAGGTAAATSIGTIGADTVGTITATSSNHDATIGAVTVGADGTSTTDGTVTAIKASGFLAASVAAIAADRVDSILVESTDTSVGGAASADTIAGNTATKLALGTVDVASRKGSAAITSINADTATNITLSGGTTASSGALTIETSVGNLSVTGGTTSTTGAIDASNASGTGVAGNITVNAGTGAATLGTVAVDSVGTITVKSTSGAVALGATNTAADTSGLTMALTAGTSIGIAANSAITNTKGDVSITGTAATTAVDANALTVTGGAAGGVTADIDVMVDFSAVKGAVGHTNATNVAIVNEGTDAASSTIVKGGEAANSLTIDGATAASAQTIQYVGQNGVDTVVLIGNYASSVITTENGADLITLGKGADAVSLVEATAAADVVTWKSGATTVNMDTITGFTVGAANDDLVFDISEIEALTQVTDFSDTNSASVTAATVTYAAITGATDLESAGVASILVANLAANIASTDALETALEVGGGLALTAGAGTKALVAGDSFLVAYDNGTDAYIAVVTTAAGAVDTTLAAGDLTATNLIKLTGVSDVSTLVIGNFGDYIA